MFVKYEGQRRDLVAPSKVLGVSAKLMDDEGATMTNVLVRLTFTLTICATTVCSAQVLGSRDDQDAINKVVLEMTEGFNKHDAVAATRMYKEDADFVSVRGEVGTGREAAEAGLRRIFETRAKMATLKTEDVKIRFIRPDVALVHVTNELSGLVAPDGQTLPSHRELSLRVLVKDNGVWRVASFHNTMLRPFTGSAPPKP